MSAEAKLDVKISADGTKAKTEVQGVARAVQDAAGQMARAYASVSVQVKAVSSAISGWQKALGLWNQFFVAVNAMVEVVKKLADWWQNAGRASEEYAQTAKAAVDEAKDAGGDTALFAALKDASVKGEARVPSRAGGPFSCPTWRKARRARRGTVRGGNSFTAAKPELRRKSSKTFFCRSRFPCSGTIAPSSALSSKLQALSSKL